MILVTHKKIRSVIANAKTENDIVSLLRYHKIKYSFTTETGFLSIRIPCKTGNIRIYKTCSRTAPFVVSCDPGKQFAIAQRLNY